MKKYIFLIDCDNFFVSCERLFRPDLRTKPVAVLSSNDACVISRSEEVKKLGISMGAPLFSIKALCKKEGVTFFSSNFELYRDISARVMSVLRRFSDTVEVYSIDEAFLSLSFREEDEENILSDLIKIALEIRTAVMGEVGVPISVGVGETKTLAKVATHFAKPRNMESMGYCILHSLEDVETALSKISLDAIWGIGQGFSKTLEKNGLETALDLYKKDPLWIKKVTNEVCMKTALELHGFVCHGVEEDTSLRKSLMQSQSFTKAKLRCIDLESAVAKHAREVAETLRSEGIVAREVYVFMYTEREDGRRVRVSDFEVLDMHTNNTLVLVEHATSLVRSLYSSTVRYKKTGVYLRDILPEHSQPQYTLFGESVTDTALMQSLDAVKERFGISLKTALEMGEKKCRVKREYISPRCTTRWSDSLRVGV